MRQKEEGDSESDSDTDEESDSESDSESDDEDNETLQLGNMWQVSPDYGELDDKIMSREHDIENGKKESGWTNPLGWTDDGHDDDLVVLQIKQKIRYDESEGPTKVDFGDSDPTVILREHDVENGKKASGWTNPLGWADTGAGDENVI